MQTEIMHERAGDNLEKFMKLGKIIYFSLVKVASLFFLIINMRHSPPKQRHKVLDSSSFHSEHKRHINHADFLFCLKYERKHNLKKVFFSAPPKNEYKIDTEFSSHKNNGIEAKMDFFC